ncbi:hypothetical protein [Bailinhaonella thermotolerans]|uniref:Uncharacterized protein n=1 Tax=Bailinhaonella thermotolerans TaxID=1070861 RepID=A0A3A4ADV5_9ACTN|nr:hypothetical protein [Bailinhaonella thermotolerans]RJL26469.1 hypothetical protein D5H75_26130 [Bailinhaonella thermotolerans]
MTESHDEYGERLRRALRAEADAVLPSAEGLERIRARIERGEGRPTLLWWRPAVAVGSALTVAAAVVVAVPALRERAIPGKEMAGISSTDGRRPEGSSTFRGARPRTPAVRPSVPVAPPPPTPRATLAPRTPTPTPCPTPAQKSRACATATPSPTPAGPSGTATATPRPPRPSPSATQTCPTETCTPSQDPPPATPSSAPGITGASTPDAP